MLSGYRRKIQAKFQSLILQCIVCIVTSDNGCKAFFKILNLPGLNHKKRVLKCAFWLSECCILVYTLDPFLKSFTMIHS